MEGQLSGRMGEGLDSGGVQPTLQLLQIGAEQPLSRLQGHPVTGQHLKGEHDPAQQLGEGHGIAHTEFALDDQQHGPGQQEHKAELADGAAQGVHPLPDHLAAVVRLFHLGSGVAIADLLFRR